MHLLPSAIFSAHVSLPLWPEVAGKGTCSTQPSSLIRGFASHGQPWSESIKRWNIPEINNGCFTLCAVLRSVTSCCPTWDGNHPCVQHPHAVDAAHQLVIQQPSCSSDPGSRQRRACVQVARILLTKAPKCTRSDAGDSGVKKSSGQTVLPLSEKVRTV